MKVSENELIAMLKRVFESYGFPVGDYEDATRMVSWMETRGFGGLEMLEKSLPKMCWPAVSDTLLEEGSRRMAINAKGASCLAVGAVAVDIAYTRAVQSGYGEVELRGSHDQEFILERLVNAAGRGMHCAALWQLGALPLLYTRINVVAGVSRILTGAQQGLIASPGGEDSLLLICADDPKLIEDRISKFCMSDQSALVETSAAELAQRHCAARDEGIEASRSLWQVLESRVASILVESTIKSRSGAGE